MMKPCRSETKTTKPVQHIPSEHHEQREFVSWFRRTFPDIFIHSIPNGAYLQGTKVDREKQGNKLNLEGRVPGVPDLLIPEWLAYIEMKALDGVVSKEQKEVMTKLNKAGFAVYVCKGFEEAKQKTLSLAELHNVTPLIKPVL